MCLIVNDFANHGPRDAKDVCQHLKGREDVCQVGLAYQFYFLSGDEVLYGSSRWAGHVYIILTKGELVKWELWVIA